MTKRQKMTRRIAWTLGAIALVFFGGVWATNISWDSDARAETAPADDPRSLVVEVRDLEAVETITRQREFTGNITAARESQLSFERPGRVVTLSVDEGDRVTAGQVLAEIDVDQVSSQLAAAKAQLQQARAVLAELVAGPRKETIAAARAQVSSLTAEMKRLELNFDRSQRLVSQSAISQEKFDEARYQLASATAQRDAAQKQLDELLAGSREERIDAQRAIVDRLGAEIQSLEFDMEDGLLKAPFAGRIAQRFVDEGTVVTTGSRVYSLVEDDNLEAWIGIPPSLANHLTIGDEFDAVVDGQGIQATLASLRPSLDPITRTRNAIFKLSQSDSQALVAGQIVRLKIDEQVRAKGFLLPTTALLPGPRGLWNLFVVNHENKIEQRNVELLYARGEESLVTGTIDDGDAVVISGVHRIVVGQSVEPMKSEVKVHP